MNIQEAIKEKTVIHCETESEAKRILKMAHKLGYKWWSERNFTDAQNNWDIYEKATCYSIKDGTYSYIRYFKDENYTIINSIEITDMQKESKKINIQETIKEKESMKEEIRDYKLVRQYPSLKKTIKIGFIVSKIYNCGGYNYRGSDSEGNVYYVSGGEVENNPDFWELIEEKPKPLFVTEDGVEVMHISETRTWAVDRYTLNKAGSGFHNGGNPNYIYFAHESNADEYIWRNKRLFSYEDMMKARHSILLTHEDIEKAAKERIK